MLLQRLSWLLSSQRRLRQHQVNKRMERRALVETREVNRVLQYWWRGVAKEERKRVWGKRSRREEGGRGKELRN